MFCFLGEDYALLSPHGMCTFLGFRVYGRRFRLQCLESTGLTKYNDGGSTGKDIGNLM